MKYLVSPASLKMSCSLALIIWDYTMIWLVILLLHLFYVTMMGWRHDVVWCLSIETLIQFPTDKRYAMSPAAVLDTASDALPKRKHDPSAVTLPTLASIPEFEDKMKEREYVKERLAAGLRIF